MKFVAPENMPDISVMVDTFQPEITWLKAVSANTYAVLDAPARFGLSEAVLWRFVAPAKALAIFLQAILPH